LVSFRYNAGGGPGQLFVNQGEQAIEAKKQVNGLMS
jgi:hypothetical protein